MESVWERIFYLVPYHVILAFFLWAYYKTVFTDIGSPPPMVSRLPFFLPASGLR